jgi:hypothetical protein
MKKPTNTEFRIARELAKQETDEGFDANQVCRWYQGELFYRSLAERGLQKIRDAIDGARAAHPGL